MGIFDRDKKNPPESAEPDAAASSAAAQTPKANLPAGFEKQLTDFFNGPARSMNSTEKARAIIEMLS